MKSVWFEEQENAICMKTMKENRIKWKMFCLEVPMQNSLKKKKINKSDGAHDDDNECGSHEAHTFHPSLSLHFRMAREMEGKNGNSMYGFISFHFEQCHAKSASNIFKHVQCARWICERMRFLLKLPCIAVSSHQLYSYTHYSCMSMRFISYSIYSTCGSVAEMGTSNGWCYFFFAHKRVHEKPSIC